MRFFLVSGIASAISAAALLSAAPASADDWTGFYVGGGLGADAVTTDLGVTSSMSPDSFLAADGFGGGDFGGTLKAGADWQLADWLVVGAFANYDWSTVETSARFSAVGEGSMTGETRLLDLQRSWAVGGRIGLVISPSTLAYGLLGYTSAKLSDPSLTATATREGEFGGIERQTNSASAKLPEFDGITFGGGFEHRITSNISLWGEYRQSRFDTATVNVEDKLQVSLDPTIHIGRVGVSYRFGVPASSAAPEAAPARRWTGTYAGLGFGVDGIEGKASATALVNGGEMHGEAEGVGGGDIGGSAIAGYDIQTGNLVGGVYVSYDRSAHDFTISAGGEDGVGLHLDIPSIGNMWLFAARAGYLVTPDVLAYVLAGYTRLEFSDWSASAQGFSTRNSSPQFDGFTLGAGFEKMIGENLSLRAEYRYSGFGSEGLRQNIVDNETGAVTIVTAEMDPVVHAVRLLATYRFNTR